MTEATAPQTNHIEITADIVAAFVSNNSVPVGDLPALIRDTHQVLLSISTGSVAASATETPAAERAAPAVPVKKSIQPDFLICLEDGKKFKSLKRHLRTAYDMTPEQYRTKWGLPNDYPMVAPNYAQQRSELAKKMGLGQQRDRAAKSGAKRSRKTQTEAAA